MSVWFVCAVMLGLVVGWVAAYPLGKHDGYHDGYTDASIDAERNAYLDRFDTDLRFRSTPDVLTRLMNDIQEHR